MVFSDAVNIEPLFAKNQLKTGNDAQQVLAEQCQYTNDHLGFNRMAFFS